MKFTLQMIVDDDQGHTRVEDIFQLTKENEHGYYAGLSLLESKQLLTSLQKTIVLHQAETYTRLHRCCPHCRKERSIKGQHFIQYKTLFSTMVIPSLRLNECHCSATPTKTLSVLHAWLPEHSSPE